jgi:hypothetical protein
MVDSLSCSSTVILNKVEGRSINRGHDSTSNDGKLGGKKRHRTGWNHGQGIIMAFGDHEGMP